MREARVTVQRDREIRASVFFFFFFFSPPLMDGNASDIPVRRDRAMTGRRKKKGTASE